MSGDRPLSEAPPATEQPRHEHPQDAAGDVVRWAAFSCAVVPVVLLWHGTPPAAAAGTALGLAAGTGVCRFLLRRSERGAGHVPAPQRASHRGRRHRSETGGHGGGRHGGGRTPGG